ncbi:deaminase domain-containing protein [Bacillus thuringiensis]|uniref:deaminase domain-containing protein n=1 Tax=Bacillus thuringiensis TaxID=1428 RepID=UPI001EE0E329|nr:deaminase domain-containing protein [Bacillus thuringiensis]MCG3425544.1 hypothetical protein [Bacillus thuringiensis]
MDKEQVQFHLNKGLELQSKLRGLQEEYKLPTNKDRNTAIGIIDTIKLPFYADSKLNKQEEYEPFIGLHSQSIPCYNFLGDITLPMRLTPDLNFYQPSKPGFTRGKEKCSERKIINEMIRRLKENKNQDDKLNIHIYTEKEPCAYCLIAIKFHLAMLYPNIQVKIYYEQQLTDMAERADDFSPEYKSN